MLLSGRCKGGPSDGKMMHHGETRCAVGRDRLSKRLIIGWQGGSTDDVEVGYYEFSNDNWHWQSPNTSTK